MRIRVFILLAVLSFSVSIQTLAQSNAGALPVIVEAEDATLGSNITSKTDGDIGYVTTTADYAGLTNPENANSVISFQVTFQEEGAYQLFARVRVGSASFTDDSFFGANGFGEKSVSDGADWTMINGLAEAGFNGTKDLVLEAGTTGSTVWKWINVSNNYYQNAASLFTVPAGELTQTFQIASREDGLDFDKLAFGKADLYYTVEGLDYGLAGTVERPEGSVIYQGPPLADGSPKFLGNVKDGGDDNFVNIWNQLTPGNEGKWASVAYTKDSTKWNWSSLDKLYNYAKDNDMVFKDHTLIWGSQQPSWINDLSEAEQLKYIETWMHQVGQRYPDMELVDVVNEAIRTHNPPDGQNGRANYKNALGGDGASGYDWVVKAFELARKYMPANTKLLLNDYGIINDNNATTIYLQIINQLRAKKVIDGIGVQCHRFEIQNASTTTLKNNLDRLAATGLPIYISEMDLGDSSGDDSAPYDDDLQLQKYQDIFPIFWEHPSVAGVTLWGSLEGKMWQKTCHLINSDNSWRPALDWLAEYIAATPVEIHLVEDTSNAEVTTTFYEAECAKLGEDWEIHEDDQASNGHYVMVQAGTQSLNSAPTGEAALINIPVVAESTGQYTVYARVNCPSADDDSFWCLMDGEDAQMANQLTTSGWAWKSIGSYYLSKGDHTLSIGYREDGAMLDKISLTTDIVPPTGTGEEAENVCEISGGGNAVADLMIGGIQNYPNPFQTSTTISFNSKASEHATLKVYDLQGNVVTTLVDQFLEAGQHEINWNGTNARGSRVNGGTYFYHLVVGKQVLSGKMMLVN